MDRSTLAALVVACVSVLTSYWLHPNVQMAASLALLLIFLVVVIAIPDAMEAGFRSGMHMGQQDAAPSSIVRVIAWVVLAALVSSHLYGLVLRR